MTAEKKGECMENLANDIMCSLFRTYAFHIANHNMPRKQILHSHSKHFVLIKVTSFGWNYTIRHWQMFAQSCGALDVFFFCFFLRLGLRISAGFQLLDFDTSKFPTTLFFLTWKRDTRAHADFIRLKVVMCVFFHPDNMIFPQLALEMLAGVYYQ